MRASISPRFHWKVDVDSQVWLLPEWVSDFNYELVEARDWLPGFSLGEYVYQTNERILLTSNPPF